MEKDLIFKDNNCILAWGRREKISAKTKIFTRLTFSIKWKLVKIEVHNFFYSLIAIGKTPLAYGILHTCILVIYSTLFFN